MKGGLYNDKGDNGGHWNGDSTMTREIMGVFDRALHNDKGDNGGHWQGDSTMTMYLRFGLLMKSTKFCVRWKVDLFINNVISISNNRWHFYEIIRELTIILNLEHINSSTNDLTQSTTDNDFFVFYIYG